MIDSHVHIGQFYDMYVSPRQISDFMREVGVERYAVSSTTMCEENYCKALSELKELYDIDGSRMMPVLWVTPCLLAKDEESIFLESGLPWVCIKIHPQLHPDFWQTETEFMDYVVGMAKDLSVPILIHTGTQNHCEAHRFEHIIKRHPEQRFILAHGRPIAETIELLNRYVNVWTDTAFMETEDIVRLVNAGLTDRVLWGSDSCIVKHYKQNINITNEYNSRVLEIKKELSDKAFDMIVNDNAINVFRQRHR